jgi:hypothetical protein
MLYIIFYLTKINLIINWESHIRIIQQLLNKNRIFNINANMNNNFHSQHIILIEHKKNKKIKKFTFKLFLIKKIHTLTNNNQ